MTSKVNPPISKKCCLCKQERLLSEFDLTNKSKDKHASICKTCERERHIESICCGGPGHTNRCLMNKTCITLYYELDCFLARVQNRLPVPPDIIEIMYKIIKQNEVNEKQGTS
jgi:hypothetical protein